MSNIDKITHMYDTVIGLFNNDAAWYEYKSQEVRLDYGIPKSVYVLIFDRIVGVMKDTEWMKSNNNYYIRNGQIIVLNDMIYYNFTRSEDNIIFERTNQSTKELIFELQLKNFDDTFIEILVGLNNTKRLIPDGKLLYIPRFTRIINHVNEFDLIRTGQIL